ncbi:hypothetical protein Tco_0962161 [Tanacetum coccineum]
MATAAFKSNSKRSNDKASTPKSNPNNKPENPKQKQRLRRSLSVSTVSRTTCEEEFLNKRDNPLYWGHLKKLIIKKNNDNTSEESKVVVVLRNVAQRGRSVVRNSGGQMEIGRRGDPSTDNDVGIVDNGCSRSMTGNKEKLDNFVQVKGGIVKFGGGDGRISGKGTIRTSKLDFENVYYVEELQHFNLFSVSQICDKKNKVLFTDTDSSRPDIMFAVSACSRHQVTPLTSHLNAYLVVHIGMDWFLLVVLWFCW